MQSIFLICLCLMGVCWQSGSHFGGNDPFTHLSKVYVPQRYMDLRLCGQSINHTEQVIPGVSFTFASLRSTNLILCGHHQRTLEFGILLEIIRDMISIVCIVFVLTRCLHFRLYRNSMNRRRTALGSHIWSRWRIFWRHAGVSRESYILHAFELR